VTTDADGRLYVGSDRGLLIVTNKSDLAEFLVTQGGDRIASQALDFARVKQQASLVEAGVKAVPDLARRIARVKQIEAELVRLRAAQAGVLLPPALARVASLKPAKAREPTNVDPENLRQQLVRREREYRNLLSQVERDNQAYGSLLNAKPVDVLPLRDRLRPGEVILQFIVTPESVHIMAIPGVNGEPMTHFNRPIRQGEFLANFVVLQQALRGDKSISDADLQKQLEYFYSLLLRPIRQHVLDHGRIYVVPTGPLTYLPWGGLARRTSGRLEFAAQSFDFAVLPSLEFLNLKPQYGDLLLDEALVFGGTNDNADRDEASRVSAIAGGDANGKLGDLATFPFQPQPCQNGRRSGACDTRLVLCQ